MKIVSRGTVFSGVENTERQSAAFANVCVLPNGRWMCMFRAAPTKSAPAGNHVLATWSDDEGRSWADPVEPFSAPVVDGVPGILRCGALTPLGNNDVLAYLSWVDHSDPTLPLFNQETEGVLDILLFWARSADNGRTWSDLTPVDTAPFRKGSTVMTGPIRVLATGEWACQFEINKAYHDPSTWHHAAVMKFSRDEGKTWPESIKTAADAEARFFYWDQRLSVLPDGTILDLFWTFDRQQAAYRNIHARESKNHGRAWSQIWDTGVPGQPAPPVALADGRIGMVYVDRTGAPMIKLRASADRGRTWPADTEIILHQPQGSSQTWNKTTMQDAWNEMGKFSVGLPDATALANGDILVTYYAGPHADHTNIEWVRIACS